MRVKITNTKRYNIQKCNLPVATVRAISKQKIEMEKIPRRSMLLYRRIQLVAR